MVQIPDHCDTLQLSPGTNCRSRPTVHLLHGTNLHSSRALQVFHGTNPVAHASAIARKGPDFTRIGGTHGASLGRGFYTSDDVKLAGSYARGTGAICVCRALQGNIKSQQLNSAETAGSLFKAGYHSVHEQGSRQIVLFHPDAVCVSFILNQGPDSSMAEQLVIAKEKLDKEHGEQDSVRLAQLEVCCFRLQVHTIQKTCLRW